jgi:endonuclease YncB( thermonuclease family)
MANGYLEVRGTIALKQFWPDGRSDADTTSILVDVDEDTFRFRPFPGMPFQPTKAFENAIALGRVKKRVISEKGKLTVRLQGIDAPELHYCPQGVIAKKDRTAEQDKLYLKFNEEYRQPLAESATLALLQHLKSGQGDPISCTVCSFIDEPSEAIDTYGRFVGAIVAQLNSGDSNLNEWLAKQGWVVPAFYNSMSETEITGITSLTNEARAAKRGIWPKLEQKVGGLDWKMIFRAGKKVSNPKLNDDTGPVLLPKLFRRLAQWAVNKRSKMLKAAFLPYLRSKKEKVLLVDEFLEQGPAAPVYDFEDLLPQSRLTRSPEELVFQEAPSRLIWPGGEKAQWEMM